MVSLFSRFSVSRSGHRRTQSAADEREVLPPASEVLVIAPGNAAGHGIEVAVEFKPVEHPIEPLDSDQPVQCPLPEPSILNDGRMWKDRLPASMRRQGDLPVVKDSAAIESDDPVTKPPRLSQSNRMILPSVSAPEHDLLNLLEECNASGL